MSFQDRSFRFPLARRHARALLAGTSVLTLLLAAPPALARQVGAPPVATSAATAASEAAAAASATAAAIARQSAASLTRATQAIQALRAAQDAARAAAGATSTNVTNGLSAGGLIVDPRVIAGDTTLWQNISAPSQSTSNGHTTVTLTQTSQRAVATWQQFNVGRDTTVYFNQSAGNSDVGNSWVVLNRIDAAGSPSQIQGQIKAEGTVLLINPNGIIFSGTSQINVHTLIAAAMDFNSLVNTANGAFKASGNAYVPITVDGLTRTAPNGALILAPSDEANANTKFLNNGIFGGDPVFTTYNGSLSGTGKTVLFSAGLIPGQSNSGIRVEAGAIISTDVSGFDNGGFVALLGPRVTNAGSITTSAGQIILAAGPSVQIAEPALNSTQTRNIVLAVSSAFGALQYTPPAVSGGALALNEAGGVLVSRRGDISLMGDAAGQFGLAEATTSITRAGSISVVASGAGTGNQVLFGPRSLTTILPEENGESIPSDAASLANFTPPRIDVAGAYVDFQSGSWVLAPSASMVVTAQGQGQSDNGPPPPNGRVVLESGSVIDLSGLTATRSVRDYLYTFKVTANDVADSPLAQSLIGKTVTIDLTRTGTRADGETWVGSPLFASSGAGYLANVTQGIDQLLTKGGSLTFGGAASIGNGPGAAGFVDFAQAAGAVVNVSGGTIQYTGARVATTILAGADGRVYDIGSANPFISYNGIAGQFTVTHMHGGVSETWTSPLRSGGYDKPGYVNGISAGNISIAAATPILEGDIVAEVVIGEHQRALGQAGTGTGGAQATPDQLPQGAALSINLLAHGIDSSSPHSVVVLAASAPNVLGPDFSFASSLVLPAAKSATSGQATSVITYATDRLTAYGLGSITITGADTLSMAQGASLSVLDGGSIKLGSVSTIDGTLTARGGSITLTGAQAAAGTKFLPNLVLGSHALLDVSGRWVNDSGNSAVGAAGALNINGGSVSLSTYNLSRDIPGSTNDLILTEDLSPSIILSAGSVIDVSSGGYVGTNGKLAAGSDGLPKGKGGNLSLSTYAGTWLSDVVDPHSPRSSVPVYAPIAAANADVVMDGAIYAGGLSQGGTFALQAPQIVIDGQANRITSIGTGADAGTVVLPTSFFTDSGFSSFKLTSTYGSTTVTSGTTVVLKQKNYAAPTVLPATGARLRDFAVFGYLPDGLRHAVDLALTQNVYNFEAAADRGAQGMLLIDAGASIVGDPLANVSLGGSGAAIVLGDITAHGGSIAVTSQYAWIGADAVLDVSGAYVPNPRVATYSTGSVLKGGSITLSSGNIVVRDGAVLDISGASSTVELPVTGTGASARHIASRQIWSDGGSLSISGTSVYFGGTIKAAGGSPSAAGGTLAVSVSGISGGSILVAQSGGALADGVAGQGTPTTIAGFIEGLLLNAAGVQTTTSTTSNVVTGNGIESFVIAPPSGSPILGGEYVTLTTVDGSGRTHTMVGTVLAYDAGSRTMRVNIAGANGPRTSTSYSNWRIAIAPKSVIIAADTINASGLDTVSFSGPLAFSGNVAIKLPGSLLIDNTNYATTLLPQGVFNPAAYSVAGCAPAASCIPSIGATNVTLEAGYIRFQGSASNNNSISPTLADGTLTLKGREGIDLVGTPMVRNAGNVNLVSDGDVRLTGTYNPSITQGFTNNGYGGIPFVGAFLVADNLNIRAREVYPTTGTAYLLMSLGLAPSGAAGTHNTITFASNGAAPVTPLSAGGAIIVDAKTIVQGGALYAPLGTIQLGFGTGQSLPGVFTIYGTGNNPYDPVQSATGGFALFGPRITTVATDSVTLKPGSLTSVSADGLMIPYGTTTDGTDWTFNNTVLKGPPAKLVVFGGSSIETQSGALIDGSGGGDVYATEYVPGTGGSRNVLTTTSQTVYALVPGYNASLAPSDPTFTTKVAAGSTVTIAGGNGIPGGTYTLLPAEYATLPGAYRVVVVSADANPQARTTTMPDSSVYMAGVLGNAISGSQSSQTALLQIQSNAVWTRYTEININQGTGYFTALAAATGAATPRLAVDAARMVLTAGTSLVLNATNRFTPAEGGLGGQLDITGTNLVVAASDQLGNFGTVANGAFTPNAAYAGYLFVDADMLSNLGIESTLIGGYRSNSTEGTRINATAANVEIATDAAHALTGPELMFTALAPTSASASVRGVVVDAGSVIIAKGAVAGRSTAALVFGADPVAKFDSSSNLTGYTAGISGDGALLRVSNGGLVDIVRHFVPGVYQAPQTTPAPTGPASTVARGNLAIGAGVTLSGNTLTLDSSGTTTVPLSARLSARNYDLSGSIVNLGGGAGGLVLSADLIANFAGADNVRLRSASVFNVYGSHTFGSADNPIGTITLDGAGLYSDGGASIIAAKNIVLVSTARTANTSGANTGGSGGSLALDASDTLTFGAGAKILAGFASVTGTAGTKVLFSGNGALDAKAAAVTLTAPLFLVAGQTSQSLVTTGALSLTRGAGTAPDLDPTVIGGSLALRGASVGVNGTIAAPGGSLTLEATTGDLELSGDAIVTAAGTRITFGDLIQDTPAGTIRLYADVGSVKLGAGTTVDVSGAGSGYAGSLSIFAGDTASLGGALKGAARYGDLGGELALIASRLDGGLPLGAGFSRSFEVSLGQGDLVIGAGQTLTSEKVLLVTNTGGIFIDGTIDASSASGGSISLFGAGSSTAAAGTAGASGVTIGANARLSARYKTPDADSPSYGNGTAALVQRGGTITLGTTGRPDRDASNVITLNNKYGYQNVSGSGAVTVAAGAIFDVSGGVGGTDIDNTGGSVVVRAPILTSRGVNVSFNGTVVTNAKANGMANGMASGDPLVLNAFAVWSTTDASTDPNKHFDGIIDPAGFFNAAGTQIVNPTNGLYPASTADAPAAGAYLPHVGFYQKTLLNFVNDPFDTNAVAASFAGAKLRTGSTETAMPSANLHLRPEIDLVNPSTSINNGNITVASNWNFGAGSFDANGNVNLLYRTANGREPGTLVLRAVNNVKINATISDGFFANYVYSNGVPDAASVYNAEANSNNYLAYLGMLTADGVPLYDKNAFLEYFLASGMSWGDFTGDPNIPMIPGGTFVADAGFFRISTSVFGSLQFKLQAPAILSCNGGACGTDVIDQYNQYYGQYIRMFDAYAATTVIENTISGGVSTGGTPGGTNLPYQFLADFYSYLFGGQLDFSRIAIPAAPTLGSSYYNSAGLGLSFNAGNGFTTATGGDYASQYTAYLFNTLNLSGYVGSGGPILTSLPKLDNFGTYVANAAGAFNVAPLPPFAPSAYTTVQTGYVSSLTTNPTPPSNFIANNPATYSVGNVAYYNTTSSADLMTAAMSGKGSFSYEFVAGARFNADGTSSVNPAAVVQLSSLSPTVTGNVSIDGHTSYANSFRSGYTIVVPTMVRTGTGAITIAAAGDFATLDNVAPGTIYTAGYVADNAAGFNAPTLPTLPDGTVSNGLITRPVWATGGGNITVTAGRDIIGIETPTDTGNQYSNNGSSAGVSTGQFWSGWYYVNGKSTGNAVAPFDPAAGGVQYSSYVNYGTFFQGFGALGGGNITLDAGRNVKDVSVSLPETIQYSGGRAAGGPAATARYYGGGNLLVEAGNDVLSGVYYVGRGTGMIRAGGSVMSDATVYQTGGGDNLAIVGQTKLSVPLLLAVQDGFIGVQAAGSIDLGAIFQPTRLRQDFVRNIKRPAVGLQDPTVTLPSAIGAQFDSYGPSSGVALLSRSGSIVMNSLRQSDVSGGYTDTLFAHTSVNQASPGTPNGVIAASLSVTALAGDIDLRSYGGAIKLYASPDSTLRLVAGGSINGFSVNTARVTMTGGNGSSALIYAGEDIDMGTYTLTGPARVWAGRDIVDLTFIGQNNSDDDITSIVAGRDILARNNPAEPAISKATTLALYGPGNFVIEAGRNLGPLSTFERSSIAGSKTDNLGGGILTIGNGANSGFTILPTKLDVPSGNAHITLRYGVAGGTDYAAAIARYGDAAAAAASGIDLVPGIVPQIEQLVDRLIVARAKAAGIADPKVSVTLTPAEAADVFKAMSSADINGKLTALAAKAGLTGLSFDLTTAQFAGLQHQQQAFKLEIDRGFLALLKQVGLDYNDPSSAYAGKYARAYEAIATLFPASLGYTDNSSGGTGAVPVLKHTGDLRMARGLVETQTGGDINLFGPGGNAYVGSNSADTLSPAQQGILTLQGGTIRTYNDGSVLVYQSRIFTEQGGNIEMFSANADLNAGKGPKSKAAYPGLKLICDSDGYCRVSPAGLVTGAGIGALLSLPGQDPTLSNVILTAPHGAIDAGAAGIRVAGNATFTALQILNAFNIQVGGTAVGIPVTQGPPVAALTAAGNVAGSAVRTEVPAQGGKSDAASIIIVEILGYGGGGDTSPPDQPGDNQRDKEKERHSYNPNSAVRFTEFGQR